MAKVLDPFRFLLIAVARWMNQRQVRMIEYLREKYLVLREQLGDKRLRLNDDPSFLAGQSNRLALAHEHFNLPQLRDNLLWRERLLGHFPGSFLSPVSPFDWYRKHRSGQFMIAAVATAGMLITFPSARVV